MDGSLHMNMFHEDGRSHIVLLKMLIIIMIIMIMIMSILMILMI